MLRPWTNVRPSPKVRAFETQRSLPVEDWMLDPFRIRTLYDLSTADAVWVSRQLWDELEEGE